MLSQSQGLLIQSVIFDLLKNQRSSLKFRAASNIFKKFFFYSRSVSWPSGYTASLRGVCCDFDPRHTNAVRHETWAYASSPAFFIREMK